MKRKRFALIPTIFVLLLAFMLSGSNTRTANAAASKRPKLVLVLISDGFRADYLDRFGDLFGKGGLKRLMTRGAWFANAEYDHSTTYTAVGHSAILSGTGPTQSGMVANDWYDRKTDSRVYCVEDPTVKFYANGKKIKKHKGSSPRNFKGTTVGDELLLSNNFQSKVISISVKDRGAILTGGKMGKSFWYSSSSGKFLTSQYYYKENPKWLDEFNAQKLAASYFGKRWKPLRPASDYARSARDDRKYETNYKGLGRTFPHMLTGGAEKPGKGFFAMLRFTPFGDKITLGLVKKAITAEKLGQRGVTDLLSISLSSVDYVGHAFGPYSMEMQDTVLQLDRTVADLFKFLDQKVGMKNVLVVMTADHGMAPIPEYMLEQGFQDAGRINPKDMAKAIDDALDKAFGPDDWVNAWWNPNVYLNLDAIRKRKLNRTEVENVAAQFLLTYPGVANTFTRTQLVNGTFSDTEQGRKMMRAFNVERSGDVFVVQKPYWYLFGPPLKYGTTHGSPFDYDSRVPIIFMGPGVKPGRYTTGASIYDIAPTLAMLLRVNPPSLSAGRVLHEALK